MNEYEGKDIRLIHGDAFAELGRLADGCVDCVLTDPPYGSTQAGWDEAPDWERLFAELWRVLKWNGALLMFAQNPLAAELICMQRRFFRYEWVWKKGMATGFLNARRMPMREHELVLVFYRALPTYNGVPIEGQEREPYAKKVNRYRSELYGKSMLLPSRANFDGARVPRDVICCSRDRRNVHPTQKPVALLRALLSQYCKAGDLVLDPFAGSGSTLVAARGLGLRAVGVELSEKYYDAARERISERLF